MKDEGASNREVRNFTPAFALTGLSPRQSESKVELQPSRGGGSGNSGTQKAERGMWNENPRFSFCLRNAQPLTFDFFTMGEAGRMASVNLATTKPHYAFDKYYYRKH